MSRGAASISVSFHVLSFRRRPFLAPATTPGLGGSQPVVKVQLHSAGDESPLHPTAHSPRRGGPGLTALLLPQIFPIFSVVAPCQQLTRCHRAAPRQKLARFVRCARDLRWALGISRGGACPRTAPSGCSAKSACHG